MKTLCFERKVQMQMSEASQSSRNGVMATRFFFLGQSVLLSKQFLQFFSLNLGFQLFWSTKEETLNTSGKSQLLNLNNSHLPPPLST